MAAILIEGPASIGGELTVQGAKNSTLPLLAASVICKGETTLYHCPRLSDVDTTVRILENLGCRCVRTGDTLTVNAESMDCCEIDDGLMREMRSSIVFLGAILTRAGEAKLSFPGGCELGPRPIDLHLSALKKLGVQIREEQGHLLCSCPGGLTGADISLSFPSVGATENILLAAVCAKGTTMIRNAAREPEICDLIDLLNESGAKISGGGESCITVQGVSQLHGCAHRVIPDRIWAATFLCAGAICNAQLTLRGVNAAHLAPILPYFEEAGCTLRQQDDCLRIQGTNSLRALSPVRTMPYPGFPTDAQAPLMALTALCRGTTLFVENIFESRYKHAVELQRMGANIRTEGKVAIVEGVPALYGAHVEAHDLRGGAALAVAALAAKGTTVIGNVHPVDRGYENIECTLQQLGAKAVRLAD